MMLLPIVVILALMFALTGALLDNTARAARVAEHAAVARYADAALADGVAASTQRLAQFVQAHGTRGPWPAGTVRLQAAASCVEAAGACPFAATLSTTITAASAPSPFGGTDTAANVQAAVIDEQRLSAEVGVTVTGRSGQQLGSRTRYLTYRVFDTAPFAVISGSRDLTTVNGRRSAAQGDSGGNAGDAVAPLIAQTGFDDTRIHVRLTCRTVIAAVVPFANDQQAAGNDGLPWGNAAQSAYETPCASADAPVDSFRDEQWRNGDTNASGWTQ